MNFFAYGTLMWPGVLEAVTGRRLKGVNGILEGYIRLRVKGQHYPVVVPSQNDSVEGILYSGLTEGEFRALDLFEGEEYNRVALEIGGTEAYVYVLSDDWKHIIDARPWYPEDLKPEHLAHFCGEYKGRDGLQS